MSQVTEIFNDCSSEGQEDGDLANCPATVNNQVQGASDMPA